MFKKKLIAIGLVAAMLGSLVACGDKNEDVQTPVASAGEATPPPAPNNDRNNNAELQSGAEDHSSVADGSMVTFEDGNYAFTVYNQADWAGDKDAVVSVESKLDSKVLYVTRPNGANPSLAVDLISLLGDNYDKCTKVSVDVGIDPKDGFSAMSGSIVVYAGTDNVECKTSWSIYKASASEKTVVIDLAGNVLDPAASNYLTFADIDDAASSPSPVFIDNIICYDASGNPLPLNSSAQFAIEGVGEYDWSNGVKQPLNETLLYTGTEADNNWWWAEKNAVSSTEGEGDYNYLKDFKIGAGDVLTVYYSVKFDLEEGNAWQACPALILQKVPDDNYAKEVIIPIRPEVKLVDGLDIEETASINDAYTIVQIRYEDIVAAAVENGLYADEESAGNPFEIVEHWGVADRGAKLKIDAVTVGQWPE